LLSRYRGPFPAASCDQSELHHFRQGTKHLCVSASPQIPSKDHGESNWIRLGLLLLSTACRTTSRHNTLVNAGHQISAMPKRRKLLLGLCVTVFASSLILALGVFRVESRPIGPFPASPSHLGFGSSELGTTGWLMPSNVSISTTYASNQSLNGFIEASFNVFPYQIPTGSLLLGLYVNGNLVQVQRYNLSEGNNWSASVLQNVASNVANFTPSLRGYTVSAVLTNPLPRGTNITVTALTTGPIWVQIDNAPTTHSYESMALSSGTLPASLTGGKGTIAPHTVSVGLEST
jgi:hypothetical protein